MTQVDLSFRIRLKSALHVGTGSGLAGTVDRRTARRLHGPADGEEVRLVCIPASSVKGCLRWHFAQLARNVLGDEAICCADRHCRVTPCPSCVLFGSEAMQGQIVFEDAVLSSEWQELAREREDGYWLRLAEFFESERRTSVSISRRRGVVMEERLFTSEVAAAGLEFDARATGRVAGVLASLEVCGVKVPGELVLLLAAAISVTHIGGGKSRGLGRCTITPQSIKLDGIAVAGEEVLASINAGVIGGWIDALPRRSGD